MFPLENILVNLFNGAPLYIERFLNCTKFWVNHFIGCLEKFIQLWVWKTLLNFLHYWYQSNQRNRGRSLLIQTIKIQWLTPKSWEFTATAIVQQQLGFSIETWKRIFNTNSELSQNDWKANYANKNNSKLAI